MAPQTREESLAKRRQHYQEHKDYYRAYGKQHRVQRTENSRSSIAKQKATNIDAWKQKAKTQDKKYRKKLKAVVLGHYSNGEPRCAMCEENRMACLSIDHISGGGRQHRLTLGIRGGERFYSWLKVNGYPGGYRVLCMNCQFVEKANSENG